MEQFSHLETYPKTGKRGRPKKPRLVIDPDLLYATVHKTRDNGKVVKVDRTVVFGDPTRIDHAIAASKVSNSINTSFIERTNLTLRNHHRKLTSSLSVLSLLADFSAGRDFLAGSLSRAHCELQGFVGSVSGFLRCVGANILLHYVT